MTIVHLLLAFAVGISSDPDLGLNPCTRVAVSMVDAVDSATAHPGDFFRFETINAVTSGKAVVIPTRTIGYGIVAIASPAGRGGRAGILVLEPRYLILRGRHVGIVLDHNASDLQRSGNSNNMPGYLGAVPLPGIGAAIGAFNYFHNGKNISVPKGTLFEVFASEDPIVAHCQITAP